MSRNLFARLVALGTVAGLATSANAVLDIASATTAVGDASVAVLAVIGLIITMAAGVWALKRVKSLFGG